MPNYDEVEIPDDDALAGPDLPEEVRYGKHAKALLESEAYGAIMAAMDESIVAVFKATPLRDTEGLLYCRLMSHVVADFDRLLRDAVYTGAMATEQLAQAQKAFKGDE